MKFSERIGAVRRVLQKDSMDEALQNALWNVTYRQFWKESYAQGKPVTESQNGWLLADLWGDHFAKTDDSLPHYFAAALADLKRAYLASDWARVYDFLEFAAGRANMPAFIANCNALLENHVSAYRFVGITLAPITSEEEIAAIECAARLEGKFAPVAEHIQTALARLADRPTPDCRNSIKESISAVEAACKIITRDPTTTLGRALKQIGVVHGALAKGFGALYNYTSDSQGIRHSLLDEPTVDVDDAKFFLVSCSAFVNYLIAKSAGAITE
jgi:hypothetical protein